MSRHHRVYLLLAIIFAATFVFAINGMPFVRYAQALPEVVQYTYSSGDDPSGVPGCSGIGIDGVTARLGTILGDTRIYWEPNLSSFIGNLTVTQGQTYWVVGRTAASDWFQIVIACDLVWVPAGTISFSGDVAIVE